MFLPLSIIFNTYPKNRIDLVVKIRYLRANRQQRTQMLPVLAQQAIPQGNQHGSDLGWTVLGSSVVESVAEANVARMPNGFIEEGLIDTGFWMVGAYIR